MESNKKNHINLVEIIYLMWGNKFLILVLTSLFSLFSIIYALSLPNYFKSETIVSVRDSESNAPQIGQYAGLAQMAGINIGASGGTDKTQFLMATLRSRDFFEILVNNNNMIIPSIMASKEYKASSGELIIDSNIYDVKTNKWIIKKPTNLEAHKVFLSSIMRVSKNDVTGYISISTEHLSPIFAHQLINNIVDQVNIISKEKDLRESKKALEFLQSQSMKTQLRGVTTSINNLIEAQIEKQMTSQISENYLIDYIDKPFIPEEKSKPSRSTIVILGFLFGISISVLIILVRRFVFNKS